MDFTISSTISIDLLTKDKSSSTLLFILGNLLSRTFKISESVTSKFSVFLELFSFLTLSISSWNLSVIALLVSGIPWLIKLVVVSEVWSNEESVVDW